MNSHSQRRCLMTSAAVHAGLLGAIVLLAAFGAKVLPEPPQPYITIVPTDAVLTGDVTSGREVPLGPPNREPLPQVTPQNPAPAPSTPPVAPPRVATPRNQVAPPARPLPNPPTKVVEVDPNRSEPSKKIDVSPTPIRTPTPDRKKLELALKAKRDAEDRDLERQATAEARNREERARLDRERRQALNDALNGLRGSLAGTTKIEFPGPGGGGAVALRYADYVQSVFQMAWNRNRPSTLAARSAKSRVSLTINRDGSFTYRVLSPSRLAEVDAVIGRILSQQRRLNPLPADLKGDDLEIIITFNLESSISG